MKLCLFLFLNFKALIFYLIQKKIFCIKFFFFLAFAFFFKKSKSKKKEKIKIFFLLKTVFI
jgi:hypothetical protein